MKNEYENKRLFININENERKQIKQLINKIKNQNENFDKYENELINKIVKHIQI